MDKEAFMGDDKTQSAIVFQLLIIGEAVKRLSPEIRNQHAEIPWSLIARMRDKTTQSNYTSTSSHFNQPARS